MDSAADASTALLQETCRQLQEQNSQMAAQMKALMAQMARMQMPSEGAPRSAATLPPNVAMGGLGPKGPNLNQRTRLFQEGPPAKQPRLATRPAPDSQAPGLHGRGQQAADLARDSIISLPAAAGAGSLTHCNPYATIAKAGCLAPKDSTWAGLVCDLPVPASPPFWMPSQKANSNMQVGYQPRYAR